MDDHEIDWGEPVGKQLKRARTTKGVTLEGLAFLTASGGERGLSRDTIAQLEGKPKRRPADTTLVRLGRALNATAEEFPAYGLAEARRLFDETEIGLGAALANLEVFEAVIQSVGEKLPDDDRVSRLLSELAATRRPAPDGGDQAAPPGSPGAQSSAQAKDRPGR